MSNFSVHSFKFNISLMRLVYDLELFEKELYKYITISVSYFDKSDNTWKIEYIQGILKNLNVENQTIEVEQHFPYINLISKLERQTIIRTFKNKEFYMIECGSWKATK